MLCLDPEGVLMQHRYLEHQPGQQFPVVVTRKYWVACRCDSGVAGGGTKLKLGCD